MERISDGMSGEVHSESVIISNMRKESTAQCAGGRGQKLHGFSDQDRNQTTKL